MRTLAEQIFHWAECAPDGIAFVHAGRPRSYRAFANSIARARRFFSRNGTGGRGMAVIVASNLVDYWILSLALRSLGLDTASVPSLQDAVGNIRSLHLPETNAVVVSPSEDSSRVRDYCRVQGFKFLLPRLQGEVPLDLDGGALPARQGGNLLLTSGTTGVHKTILMDSSFDAEMLDWRSKLFSIDAESVVDIFHFTAWTGVGYKSTASTWYAGGTVVMHQAPDPRQSQFAPDPHRSLLYPGLTHAFVVPPLLDRILSAAEDSFPCNASMRIILTGGTVAQDKVDQAKARIAPLVYNVVAATEANPFLMTRLEYPEDRRWHQPVPGRGTEIVDEHDEPAPPGVAGRLRVSTSGGPTGYFADAEATRAHFKGGFFYPGDLAILCADGRIALHGRTTDVLNVRGAKIAPAPIEDALAQILNVSGVCLFSMQNDDADEQIHIIVETSTPLPARDVEAALESRLSGFPQARIHYLSSLPRNAMGKLLRQLAKKEALGSP